ncbi:hypothetical protein OIDMADRAFT_20406 [Oidiodendron maius Zn]|uniref:Uncharacterized protein n=1 Tax=Oidiodendron maius (strain Zn) TaxID=913774 RepID=A0A0C3GQ55_OIDMZ|nr:hypothetical protein OIDMADRAFT_20406 [Oidiodendron maius Zn]
MSVSASRAVLRQSTKLSGRATRRFQSTTTKAADTAKDAATKATSSASNIQSKASEGLSRVTSAAGPAISGAAKGLGNALGRIGGRTGRLIQFVERQIPSAIYYTRVGLELSKLVFHGQKMTPPPVSTFQAYFQRLVKGVRNPSTLVQGGNPVSILQQLRNVSSAQLATGAVITAELLGFFTVGEMIGRFKLIGYRGDTHAHH